MRRQLTDGWEMVSASTLPLITLAVMTVLGSDLETAVFGALICTTVLLSVAGWSSAGVAGCRPVSGSPPPWWPGCSVPCSSCSRPSCTETRREAVNLG